MIEELMSYTGKFEGAGLNHDQEKFTGILVLSSAVNGKGVAINFTAKGDNGEIFHEEQTLIAPNESHSWSLWTLNNNVPYAYEHHFIEVPKAEGAKVSFGFAHNNLEDANKFRETIVIDLYESGDIGYRYAWGLPGAEFKERSGLMLFKVNKT
ncbi:MAG: hypothetical protein KDD58_02370 [Bdellovibrionales bacterium]|nr:hypothetical protein [Bdellovibrionales bacterium]